MVPGAAAESGAPGGSSSGDPGEGSQLTRTPYGPYSAASWRQSPAEDDTAAAAGHVPADRGGDVEVCRDGFGYGAQEVLEGHVEERGALDIVVGCGVEADVDAAGVGDCGGMPFDRGQVEDVEARDVCSAAVAVDALGDRLERRGGSAREMHLAPTPPLRWPGIVHRSVH